MLELSEKNIMQLTSLLRDSHREIQRNKNKLAEAERITRGLSESLKNLDNQSKLKAEADSISISSATSSFASIGGLSIMNGNFVR